MRLREATLAILAALLASLAVADDFKTISGKEYKNAKVSRVEPDGIVLITRSGISKVYFSELPKEVQQRFNYNPEQAAAYSAQQNAAQATPTPQSRRDKKTARRIAELGREIAVARQGIQISIGVVAGGTGARFAAQDDIQRQEQRIQRLQKELQQLGGSCQ
jgi:uncharacterized protein with beta-barrel porin domain